MKLMKKLFAFLSAFVLFGASSAIAELGEADVVMEGEAYHLSHNDIGSDGVLFAFETETPRNVVESQEIPDSVSPCGDDVLFV